MEDHRLIALPQFTDTALEVDDSIPAPIPLTNADVSPSPEDSIPAIVPLTADDPIPNKDNLKYMVIIDAGSSGTRLSIYTLYEGTNPRSRRLGVALIFGPINSSGGIHRADSAAKMNKHLNPILTTANQVLAILNASRDNTAIYLLATGGMRSQAATDLAVYNGVLANARTTIKNFRNRRFAYRQAYIRTITGQQEGWLAWIFQNYGSNRFEVPPGTPPGTLPRGGSLEMGGASVQYAFTVSEDNAYTAIICSNPDNPALGRKKVYSQTWEGLGSNSLNNKLVNHLQSQCLTEPCGNPCLPKDMPFKTKDGFKTEGTGDFDSCYAFASATHIENLLPDLRSLYETDFLRAISTFYYTYQFFTNQTHYNAVQFEADVREYCQGNWDEVDPDEYAATRCLNAAWMLVSFKEVESMDIIFSKAVDWPHAAAALIANHEGLKGCPEDNEWAEFVPPVQAANGNSNVSSLLRSYSADSLPAPAQLYAAPVTPSITLWAYLPFALVLIFIIRLLIQHSRAKALSKIHLPDLEENVGAKGNMEDLAGTILGSEGFYKD